MMQYDFVTRPVATRVTMCGASPPGCAVLACFKRTSCSLLHSLTTTVVLQLAQLLTQCSALCFTSTCLSAMKQMAAKLVAKRNGV